MKKRQAKKILNQVTWLDTIRVSPSHRKQIIAALKLYRKRRNRYGKF